MRKPSNVSRKTMEDEYLDLVDENDKIIGRKERSEVYKLNLSNFRVVNAFIRNKKGLIWVPRRSASKRIFPLCLDMSMGGHVSSGETYLQAFKRELKEELNINASKVP
ncbi:MAG TPA: NUDIX domain-containing protein [Candidatus Nanoarchaeia archaeon]|nr:NUDIX domain-containing protein [Candidatus Nanoarchaeia archaeon]